MRQLQKFMKYNRTFCQEGLGHLCCTFRVEQTFYYKAVTLKWSLLISAALIKILRQAAEVLYISLRCPHFTSLNCDLPSAGIKWAARNILGGRRSSGPSSLAVPEVRRAPFGSWQGTRGAAHPLTGTVPLSGVIFSVKSAHGVSKGWSQLHWGIISIRLKAAVI